MGAPRSRLCLSALILVAGLATSALAGKQKLKPEEIITRHLEALGSPSTVAARQSLEADGKVLFEVVVGGSGQLQGPSRFISEGRKLRMSMVFDVNDYPGEDVALTESGVEVGWIQPGVRSTMGQFFYQFDEIITEGLLGGVLSTGWSLLHLESLNPKLKYEGIKKLDKQPYHTLRYQRRKGTDVQARLYFEPETFRHAHSIYKVRISSPIIANNSAASASQPETWYTLKESFTNFQDIRGLDLPTRWILEYSKEIGRTGSVLRFTTQYESMLPNAEIDNEAFKIH